MSWGEFFAMGGYAPYVWGSYVVATVVLLANVLIPLRRRRTVMRRLREFYRVKGRIK